MATNHNALSTFLECLLEVLRGSPLHTLLSELLCSNGGINLGTELSAILVLVYSYIYNRVQRES